ncbi:MAG: glycosyltransferase family 4 protein [Vicinamibacterales bacterium]
MSALRLAFITNLCPYYRRPLFEVLGQRFNTSFFFFSEGEERYLGPTLKHEPGGLPVRNVRRVSIAGSPLLVGLYSELRPENYDVVVKCINGRLMLPFTYHLARRRDLPFVLWSGLWHHPQTVAHRASRRWVEHIYRGADAIVTYGDHVRRFIGAVPGVNLEKVYVAGQAIDSKPFSNVAPHFPEPARILYVGRLEESKGVPELLRAFSAMKRNGDGGVLRLIGTGPLVGKVRAAAGAESGIEVLGYTPNEAIPGELAHARCLVLPSVTTKWGREPWGLVINEAMAAGVPVITTDAVGAAAGGLVRDGRNGFVVPEKAPDALAAAMSRLVSDASLAGTLGARARVDVAEFDYSRMVHAFADAIEHAVTAGNPKRRDFIRDD